MHTSYILPKGKAVQWLSLHPVVAGADPSPSFPLWHHHVQGQLCHVTCAGERNPLNHARMSVIQLRRPEKKAENMYKSCPKNSHKSWSTTLLHFLLSNPMIFKAFSKNFPTKTKPVKFPERKGNKRGGGVKKSKRGG